MSGHSKWANTKHRKSAQDTKRGKIFTKIIREIITAARLGGSDPGANPRLRAVIDKALSKNMTHDIQNRAIARAIGDTSESKHMESFIYEGYGPSGTAIIVECLSDNRNRTAAKVRYAFSKCGGNLGTDGSVSYLFKKKGIISFKEVDENIIIEMALEAGAEDIMICDNNEINVYTAWEEVNTVCNVLETAGLKSNGVEISMIPFSRVDLDEESAPKLFQLIDMLEDHDDVQKVHHNGRISSKITAILNNSM